MSTYLVELPVPSLTSGDVPRGVSGWSSVVRQALLQGMDLRRLSANRRLIAWLRENLNPYWRDAAGAIRLVHISTAKRALKAHDEWSLRSHCGLSLDCDCRDRHYARFLRALVARLTTYDEVVLSVSIIPIPTAESSAVWFAVARYGGWPYWQEDKILGPFLARDDLVRRFRRKGWVDRRGGGPKARSRLVVALTDHLTSNGEVQYMPMLLA